MLAPVLDGVVFVVTVAFEADKGLVLGLISVRKADGNESDRDTSDCDGNRDTSDDEGR